MVAFPSPKRIKCITAFRHSPQIIASTTPTAFHLATKHDMESQVQRLDATDVEHHRALLAELGASMADSTSAERILWVEGPTEEQAFPRILSGLTPNLKVRINASAIHHLLSTFVIDESEKPDREMVAEHIERLMATPEFYKQLGAGMPASEEGRLRKVHGSGLLDHLIRELVGNGYDYSSAKVEYGVTLTRWIVESEPEAVREIDDLLAELMDPGNADQRDDR